MNEGRHPPEHLSTSMQELPQTDCIVLEEIARLQIEGTRGVVMYDDLCASKALSDMPQQEWLDAVVRMDKNRLVKMRHAFGVPFAYVTLTEIGSKKLAGA